ncbi:MAG TPA: metal-dependent transcriptional regulator [Longimicrobiales bacterium]
MTSPAAQDYLKAIYKLSRDRSAATTSGIAARLRVAAGSVTGMLKRLAEQGYVEHVPYYGARLTEEGEREALRTIRRHRVLEAFLVQQLGYTWDEVHEEAERLEHAASDELIDRMAKVLGEPREDPHGHPIPARGRAFIEEPLPTLADLEEGRSAVLRRVTHEDPEALRYLAGLGLVPGARLTLHERAPFGGPLRLTVEGEERLLGHELSRVLEVEPLDQVTAKGDENDG